jgi:hypothetical protein
LSKYVRKADRPNLPQAALARHGVYANAAHQEAILTRHPEIMAYIRIVRRGFVRDLSPEGEAHMTTAKHVILDRLMGKLKMSGLIEAYLSENGIIRRDKLAQKVLDPEPITSLWLGLNHQIRLDIQLLGLERRALDITLTTDQMSDAILADLAEKGTERPVAGKTISGGVKPRADSDDAPGGEINDKGDKDG